MHLLLIVPFFIQFKFPKLIINCKQEVVNKFEATYHFLLYSVKLNFMQFVSFTI